jgi:hypothetical protein
MIVVNLQQIGPSEPRFCEPAELSVIYTIAQDIMQSTDSDTLDSNLDRMGNCTCVGVAWKSQLWEMNGIIVPCC